MRKINADDAIARIRKLWTKGEPLEEAWEHHDYAFGLSDAIDAVDDSPTIEPKRGEWIEQEDCWQCSECGDEYVLEVDVKPIDAKMYYCPNCGADMREREGE